MSNIISLNVTVKRSRTNQLFKLVQRRLLTFYRDKTDLVITFGQAPILAIAFFFVFQKIVTVGVTQSFFQPLRIYLAPNTVSIIVFLAVLTAVWFGSSKAIVEIPGTKVLYQQERLSFLGNFNYLISIFISLSIIAFGQVLLFALTFHSLFIFLPAWFQPYDTGLLTEVHKAESVTLLTAFMPKFFILFTLLLWLTAVASIAVAMFVSMFTPSRSAANAILPFILIVQILFAGSVIKPIMYMSPTIQTIANVMVSRWGFEAAVLLFERDLNLQMPRQEDHNEAFSDFNFNYGLIKFDTQNYTSQVIDKGTEFLSKSPLTSQYWQESIVKAAEKIKYFSDEEMTEVESQYIENLEKLGWSIKEISQPTPSRLSEEIIKQFNSSYSSLIDNIISKVDDSEILTKLEQNVWTDAVNYDSTLKLFRRPSVNQISEDNFQSNIDAKPVWIILLILTFGVLLLEWMYFSFIIKQAS
ncbi:hypothetical protein QUF74_12520 [Candidatus Halobeggiatoa sp. HSG11]|nr:hypothetical protein [Candidatus Halobeggiatoa sp. HSG11]